ISFLFYALSLFLDALFGPEYKVIIHDTHPALAEGRVNDLAFSGLFHMAESHQDAAEREQSGQIVAHILLCIVWRSLREALQQTPAGFRLCQRVIAGTI